MHLAHSNLHGLKISVRPARRICIKLLNITLRLVLPFSTAILLSTGSEALAQEAHCDPLIPISRDTNYVIGYKPRGNRCEGIYPDQKSGSSDIFVVSLAAMALSTALSNIDTLYIRWPEAPARDVLKIRALSLRDGLNYRLDSTQPLARKIFEWPSEILKQVGLQLNEVGLLGSSDVMINNSKRRVYIPTILSDQPKAGEIQSLELVLRTNIDLSDVYWSYAPFKSGGRIGEYIVYEKHFQNFYPAGEPIRLKIEAPPTEGLYNGEISTEFPAYVRQNTPPATSFVFYYSGKALQGGD